jgi:hypothetical protein
MSNDKLLDGRPEDLEKALNGKKKLENLKL